MRRQKGDGSDQNPNPTDHTAINYVSQCYLLQLSEFIAIVFAPGFIYYRGVGSQTVSDNMS